MLVLTRNDGDSITLTVDQGEGKPPVKIEVVTFGYQDGQMKVGIKAPRSVNVVRSELLEDQ